MRSYSVTNAAGHAGRRAYLPCLVGPTRLKILFLELEFSDSLSARTSGRKMIWTTVVVQLMNPEPFHVRS